MEKSNKRFSRKANKGARRGNQKSGYQQKPDPGYSYKPDVRPIRAKRIPNEFSVALVNTDYDTFAAQTTYVIRKFGIVEFLSFRPLYCLELYQIWKYVRVTAIELQVNVCNTGVQPIMMAIGCCSNSDLSGLTPDRSWETPGTQRRLLSGATGMDRGTVKKLFVGQDAYGQPYLDQKFWIDVSQSASTTPVDANEPVAYYMISDSQGGALPIACRVEWKITYHLQFFDLRIPSSSLSVKKPQEITSDEDDEVCSIHHGGNRGPVLSKTQKPSRK